MKSSICSASAAPASTTGEGRVDRAFIRELRTALAAHGEPRRARQQQAYMKSAMPYHGIAAPTQRALTAEVVAHHPQTTQADLAATMAALWHEASHREERYAAIELARAKPHRRLQGLALVPVYEMMITSGAWWDYVDDISGAGIAALLPAHAEVLHPLLRQWAHGDNLWLRRAAIICQRRLKPPHFNAELLYATILPSIGNTPLAREFFLRKGIGWALRERSYAAPAEVVEFCRVYADELAPLTLREALRVVRKRDVS